MSYIDSWDGITGPVKANVLIAGMPPKDYKLLSGVRLVVSLTASHRRFNKELMKKERMMLALSREAHAPANAEFALLLALNHLRRLATYVGRPDRGSPIRAAADSDFLIVGYGHTGRELRLRLQALGGRRIDILDPYVHDKTVAIVHSAAALEPQAYDVMLVSAQPYRREDKVVTSRLLAALKPDGAVVNVSRETYVNETAMLNALDSGAFYYSDFADEPFPLLKGHPNSQYTPHIATFSVAVASRCVQRALERLTEFLRTGRMGDLFVDLSPPTQK